MAEIGDTLLRAAQGIVAQLQGQTRLQMQQQQFSAQLQQAERTFSLRQQELEARQKLLDMQEQEFKLKQEAAPVQLDFLRAQAESMRAKASPEALEREARLTESIIQKNLASTSGRGGGLSAKQMFDTRQELVRSARNHREKELSEQLATNYQPKSTDEGVRRAERAFIRGLSGLTLEELIDQRARVQVPGALEKELPDEVRQRVIEATSEMITQIRGAISTPMTQKEQFDRILQIEGVAPTDTMTPIVLAQIMNTRVFPPQRLAAIFGESLVSTSAGQSELTKRIENDDVSWFVSQLRPRAVTPDGKQNEELLIDFASWVAYNKNEPREFLRKFKTEMFGE